MKISQAVLQAVSELDLRSRRRVLSLLAGNYRTAFRGSGMQFKEFRHYEPGDDIRHMSWAVTARTGRATVKLFEEERELNVVCLVDVSGSSLLGSGAKRKIDMYADLLGLVGLAAIKSGDNLGMILFNEKPQCYLPPKRTQDHVLVGLTHLMNQPLRGTRSDLKSALVYTSKVLKSRSLILILSDFLVPPFENELRMLARKHEIIFVHCYDDAERGAHLKGVYEVCDPETGEFYLLDANSKRTREVLANHQQELSRRLQELAETSRSDYLSLSVEDDYLQKLVRFFRLRGPSRL